MNEGNQGSPVPEQQEGTDPQAETAPVATTPDSPVTITVDNPNKEEMAEIISGIDADYDFDVDVKPTVFNFKKSKDKATGVETIREAVQLAMPYPSVAGIVAILENKHGVEGEPNKGLELLMEAVEGIVNAAARDLLYEDTGLNAATFPVDKISWDFISKIPKVQRKGGGIPKETWEAFAADYIEIMPAITGKSLEQIGNAAKILLNKLSQVRTNFDVLKFMVQQLGVYAENSPNIEEYQECVEFLANKADMFLNVTPEELLASL